MDTEEIIARLRQHESELKAAGIVRLALFGSVARGDAMPESNVDLMAEFDAAMKFTILGRVGLGDLLGARVDLAHTPMMREGIRERAAYEALTVF